MATFTNQVTVVGSTLAEYETLLARVLAYSPGAGEPTMTDLSYDGGTRTISYTLTSSADVS